MLLGLSILVASVSFLCYRCPPSEWAFLRWLRPALQDVAKKHDGGQRQDVAPKQEDASPPTFNLEKPVEEEKPSISTQDAPLPTLEKAELDRKAMPPPSLPIKKPTQKYPFHARTAVASPTPSIPTLTLGAGDSAEDNEEPTAPSFPALNSAQRASGGTRGPPRLNPQPSAGLMAPPLRSPLPNRGPPGASSSSLLPPATHSSIPAKPRRKVQLEPGHSPLDWARLASSPTANLRGLPPSAPYIKVPPSLLKQYTGRKGKDAWTVLGGKVYNISPYVPYHPGGGPELLKAAGRDGTRLFGEVHPWVNWEGMLENCLVGVAVEEGEKPMEGGLDEMD